MNTLKSTTICVLFALATGLVASAQVAATGSQAYSKKTKAQKYVELVSRNDILKDSEFAVLAMKVNGDTVAAWNPHTRMLPASNMKLITTGATMHALGPDYKFTTRIACTGEIVDGVLKGDLYIIGGGDPTIASKDSIAIPRFFLFSKWKKMVEDAGIKKIEGRVVGDGRYFDGMLEKDSWAYHDIGCIDGCGSDGLCYYENVQEMTVSAGAKVGDPITYSPKFPSSPWMKFESSARTGKAGTGDNLFFWPTEYIPYGEIRGSFAIDRKPKTEEFSNKFGAYTCAYYFRDYLISNGIEVSGKTADVRLGRIREELSVDVQGPYAAKVDDMKILGSTASATLKEIARHTNLKSDNFYAETFLRTLGRTKHHSACYDSSYVALKEVLDDLGVPQDQVQIRDGSGLSRHDYLTPQFIVTFLRRMMESPVFPDYIETIGVAGGPHYVNRLNGESQEIRERIHLKSGSMNGVRCYSGYIEPVQGTKNDVIIFSLMTNNALVSASKVDPILDKIMAALAAENIQ